MAVINVWSMLITLAEQDRSVSQSCKAIVEECSKHSHFANEFTFAVDETTGAWTFHLSNCYHEGSGMNLVMTVQKNGHVSVRRDDCLSGIRDDRTVSF